MPVAIRVPWRARRQPPALLRQRPWQPVIRESATRPGWGAPVLSSNRVSKPQHTSWTLRPLVISSAKAEQARGDRSPPAGISRVRQTALSLTGDRPRSRQRSPAAGDPDPQSLAGDLASLTKQPVRTDGREYCHRDLPAPDWRVRQGDIRAVWRPRVLVERKQK